MPTAPRAATEAGSRSRGPADVLWAAVVAGGLIAVSDLGVVEGVPCSRAPDGMSSYGLASSV